MESLDLDYTHGLHWANQIPKEPSSKLATPTVAYSWPNLPIEGSQFGKTRLISFI